MELEIPEFNGTLKWAKSYLIYLEAIVRTTKAVSYEPCYTATPEQPNQTHPLNINTKKYQDMSWNKYLLEDNI